MSILVVAGARPNFMKVKPIVDALEAAGADVVLVHTGQHYDAAMSDVFFDDIGLRPPDEHLGTGGGSHAEQAARVMVAFEALVVRRRPRAVVVVGDVTSTMACAVVGATSGALVAHVEAGLRSRDWAMPEEVNRVVADRVSHLLLASAPDGVENLRAEGYRDDQIVLVGNTMIDTLLSNIERARSRSLLTDLSLERGHYGAVTLHRPSNVDDPETLSQILDALGEIAAELPLVFPVHPRTRKNLAELSVSPGIRLVEPLGYLDFLALEDGAAIALTDSGGVQEETTVLGVPCLTLRDNTERPITIGQGTNVLVGTERERIVAAARRVLRDGVEPRHPELWDGHAGTRIARAVLAALDAPTRLDPTSVARG